MNINYSRESGSLFPDQVINIPDFKDVDDSIKDIIMQYYQLLSDNDFNSARMFLRSYPELDNYIVNAKKLNLLFEELQNIAIFAKLQKLSVISQDEPLGQYDIGTAWYQPVESDGV